MVEFSKFFLKTKTGCIELKYTAKKLEKLIWIYPDV